jgi:hypothetical protein
MSALRLMPVLVALVVAACAGPAVPATPGVPPPADLLIVIPRGAASAEMRGEASVAIPPVIALSVGQRVLIRNDDVAMHYFFQAPIAPGQTLTRSFDQPGRHTYSGVQSCSVGQLKSLVVDVAPYPTPGRSTP